MPVAQGIDADSTQEIQIRIAFDVPQVNAPALFRWAEEVRVRNA